ncbi:unnamed protein product, partial [Ectocarpus sp. 12 AP-2014]
TSRTAATAVATAPPPAVGAKPRHLRGDGASNSAPADVNTSSPFLRGPSLSEAARPTQPSRQPDASAAAAAGSEAGTETDGKGVEGELPSRVVLSATVQPVAWTNSPSHPLGMKPEPAPLPPASEMPRPPPQHQQHWQRQQQREQQQQRQQQHNHHFFHQQEPPPLMPMSAGPVPPQHQDVNHHYPPLSLPPQPPPHHHRHPPPPPPPPQHEVMMPHYIPPSEDAF